MLTVSHWSQNMVWSKDIPIIIISVVGIIARRDPFIGSFFIRTGRTKSKTNVTHAISAFCSRDPVNAVCHIRQNNFFNWSRQISTAIPFINQIIIKFGMKRISVPKRNIPPNTIITHANKHTKLTNCSGDSPVPVLYFSNQKATISAVTVVIGAVGPDAWIFVQPSNEVMIGMIAAANIPAKIPLHDWSQNAAQRERAANETVSQARNSVRNLFRFIEYIDEIKQYIVTIVTRVGGIGNPTPPFLVNKCIVKPFYGLSEHYRKRNSNKHFFSQHCII